MGEKGGCKVEGKKDAGLKGEGGAAENKIRGGSRGVTGKGKERGRLRQHRCGE